MAKAACWRLTDAEARKRGEQTGLDTLVVHAVNDGVDNKMQGVVRRMGLIAYRIMMVLTAVRHLENVHRNSSSHDKTEQLVCHCLLSTSRVSKESRVIHKDCSKTIVMRLYHG